LFNSYTQLKEFVKAALRAVTKNGDTGGFCKTF
jgi:hypothetical protein